MAGRGVRQAGGPTQLDVAEAGDVRELHALVTSAGWAYSASDIERLMRIEPGGLLVAVDRSRGGRTVVGCVYAPVWGGLGFIGLLLVRADLRGRGLGGRLLDAGLARLRDARVSAVGLDSVQDAISLYRRAGFVAEWESMRLAIDTSTGVRPRNPVGAREARDGDMAAVLGLDLDGWGADRGRLLVGLRREGAGIIAVAPEEGAPRAYCALRRGPYGWRMGPWVADPSSEGADAACALLAWAMGHAGGLPLTVGVPAYNTQAVEATARVYAVRMRPCVRMYLGDPGPARAAAGSWAIGAPEKG